MIELMNEDAIFGVDLASGPDVTVITSYPLDANAPVTVTLQEAFESRKEVVAVYPDGWQMVRVYGTHGYFEMKERVPEPQPPQAVLDAVDRLILQALKDSEMPPNIGAYLDAMTPDPSGPPPLPAIAGLTQNTFDGERLGRLSWMPGAKE